MKHLTLILAAALGSLALAGLRPTTPDVLEPGAEAPEIDAQGWFNHIGAAPTLEGLRGQAVLLEFWATW